MLVFNMVFSSGVCFSEDCWSQPDQKRFMKNCWRGQAEKAGKPIGGALNDRARLATIRGVMEARRRGRTKLRENR
jgi:hypothetical protein